MEKLKDKRKQSGITLIALIITIIVLLILAGVAINTLTGEGSIIANANKVVEMNNIANVKEKIELEIIGTILKENNEVTLDKIIDDLIDKGITTEENSDRESGQIKTEEGYIFQIEETENGSYEVEYVGNGEFVKESIHISYELSTNGIANKVIITTRASAESGIKSYEINGENRKTYGEGTTNIEETYEVTANGTYIIKITNNNGEEKTKEIEINNILEGTIQMMPDKTSPTRENVKITIIWPTGSERGIKEIKVGNNQWQSASGEKSEVEVTENCTVEARVRNSDEDVITSSITISNIDKNNPTVTATSGIETIEEGTSNEISKYFTYSENGTAEITNVTYTDTSNGDTVVTNTNTLAVGTHIIKCTVTKETGAVASATKTIEVEKKEIVISDGNWTGEVNSPMLMEGMTAVYWSTDGGVTASTTQEGAIEIYAKIDSNGKASSTGTDNANFKWENWYAYTAGDNVTDTKTSRWANAVTDDGSYWVWIPRYKYKITNEPTSAGIENAGKIDVEFIPTTDKMGTTGYTTEANADGEIITTDSEGYIIHPAFENGSSTGKNNGFENGEWDSELPGFWIAKYEMSMEDGEGNALNTDEVEGNVAISAEVKMVSKPNVSSWREIQIGQIYQNCIKYDTGKNSHMIKNSEWRSRSILNP